MSAELVPATGALLEQVLDATYPLWGEELGRAGYFRYNEAQLRTAWGATHLQRLALVDQGRLLATAKRYTLRAHLDGQDVATMGIGAVFAPAALRGHGYAGELIRRMMAAAAGEGIRLAVLFSEIKPHFYEQLGFQRVPLTQLLLEAHAGRRPGAPAVPMRSGDMGDLRAIVEMNAAQAAGFRLALARDVEYARHAIARKRLLAACGTPGHRSVEFFVVEEGGRAAAYLILFEVGDYWMVTECGDRDPSGARVGAMLQALMVREERRTVTLRAWLPPGFLPPQLSVIAREAPPIAMMMRPIGPQVMPDPPLKTDDVAWWHADAF